MITKDDEADYRDTISHVNDWSKDTFLDLNVSKTKELIFDFRKQKSIVPVHIDNDAVEIVSSYKYLGINAQDNLKWDVHVDYLLNKAMKRFYHVRCLKYSHADINIICLFYNAVIFSVFAYSASTWYGACSVQLCDDIKT